MELNDARKLVKLMEQRDSILDMRADSNQFSNAEWAIKIKDSIYHIPHEVKSYFVTAIYAALDEIEKEIEKL